MKAPTIFDDNVESQAELNELLEETLVDEPIVEISTNYLGYEQIKEDNMVHLKHQPLGYSVDLKVIKLTEYHPLVNVPVEIDFSNSRKDIIQIQQIINSNIKNFKNSIKYGVGTPTTVASGVDWITTGVVSIDEWWNRN